MQNAGRRGRWVVARFAGFAAVLLTTAASCAMPWEVSLTQDRRIEIDVPAGNSSVSVPFDVSWQARDFRTVPPELGTDTSQRPVAPDTGYFAVFVDGPPMPPGEPFDALLRDDPACAASPTCPSADYLARRLGILITDGTSVTVNAVSGTGVGGAGSNLHSATVVIVDSRGRRIGDSSWYVSFSVDPRRAS